MPDRVLLTGASGFLGRRIEESLRRRGYEVAAPRRPEFDLMDAACVRRTLEAIRPRTVVHSAAYYGGLGICVAEPATIFHRNIVMAANLLDACAAAGVKRFVPVGSACSYPGAVAGDMSETDFWAGPLHPSVEAYGFTKKVLEVGGHAYEKQFGLECQHPVITNLYGEHDVFGEYRSHVVAALIKKFADAVLRGADEVVCWGTGSPVREFLYVADAAEGIARLIETDVREPINIGTGIGTSILELAELVARFTGFAGQIVWDTSKPDGVMRKVLAVSKMKEVLDWEPPTALAVGLQKTIAWYLANKEAADART